MMDKLLALPFVLLFYSSSSIAARTTYTMPGQAEHESAQPGAVGRSADQNETTNGTPISATLDRAHDQLFYAGGNSPCDREGLANGCSVRRGAVLFLVRGGELIGLVDGHALGGQALVDALGMIRGDVCQ